MSKEYLHYFKIYLLQMYVNIVMSLLFYEYNKLLWPVELQVLVHFLKLHALYCVFKIWFIVSAQNR